MLIEVIGNKTDSLLISETKLHDIFPLSQFILGGFSPPHAFDKTEHSRGVMAFVRENIPFEPLPNINTSGNIENILVGISLK